MKISTQHIFTIILSFLFHSQVMTAQQFQRTGADNTPTCSTTDYYIVTGESHRCYLNACWAQLKGETTLTFGYNSENFKVDDVYTWPVLLVCLSEKSAEDIPQGYYSLGDGTFLYTEKNGNTFRGTQSICDFLSAETLISTPRGEIPISNLSPEDSIYAVNREGNKAIVPIRILNKALVSPHCEMIRIELADGRKLTGGTGHFNRDYNNFGSDKSNSNFTTIKVGQKIQGSKVIKVERLNYEAIYAYDILPWGINDYYWNADYLANGIRVKSPMGDWFYTEDLLRLGW